MGCGYYVNDYQDPKNHDRAVEDFAEEMIGQILHGAWGTDVRAGMIGEIGCSAPWTDTEKRVMQAALIAAAETGAAINVHPGRDPDQPQEVADFVKAAGHPTERIVISHIDRTIFDETRLLRLAELRRHHRVRPVRPGGRATTASPTSTCPTTRRGCS